MQQAGYDTYFYALNANTSAQQWSFSLNRSISSYAVVANGTVYLNSYGPYANTPLLYALDANSGTQKWTSSTILSVLAVSNGIAYCAGQMDVYALSLSSSTQLWKFPTADSIRELIVANDVVYAAEQPVSGPKNTLYALDARTGTQKWSFSKNTLFFYTPVVANGFLYLGSYAGNLYAFHLDTL